LALDPVTPRLSRSARDGVIFASDEEGEEEKKWRFRF
jgi:hypothetical protein